MNSLNKYRECYQPAPAVHLPAWMRRLWSWL